LLVDPFQKFSGWGKILSAGHGVSPFGLVTARITPDLLFLEITENSLHYFVANRPPLDKSV
jgi:hypothetical protein